MPVSSGPTHAPSNEERPSQRRPSLSLDDDKPQPLSPKTAVLLARRRKRSLDESTPRTKAPATDPSQPPELSSEDGAVAYALRAIGHRLTVIRTQRRPLDSRVIQSLAFTSAEEFLRWCEADPVRFDYPILYERLRRVGDELLSGQR